jgi:cysteine desulfurase/selenocysteine lyase
MNAPAHPIRSATFDRRADFPAIEGWTYLDSAATAQKPRQVIAAIDTAYARDYATVHRGVYARSASMTEAYEAARAKVAGFVGAGSPSEIVFVRGATEAINLIAQSWGVAHLKAGDRVLLSRLEHHSNIVPWQLLRNRLGIEIDVAPLTDDHCIDADALEALLTPRTKLVSITHVSNVLGSIADVPRIARAAHAVGAKLLVDGCQAAPRLPVDVAALGCDFYVFSGHKLYGPTGIGVLWARPEILLRLFGPDDSAGIVSFAMDGVHPHDIGTILDEGGIAIRAGHHCAQPLMEHLGVPATARASFGIYNVADDIDRLVEGIARVTRIFG